MTVATSSGRLATDRHRHLVSLTFATVARRGLIAGAAGGVASATVLLILGESRISDAIAIEQTANSTDHHEMFSRTVQVVGGVGAAVIAGLALGLVYALVFATVRHRLRWPSDAHRAVALAAAGFVILGLVPFLKYPANPPGIGDPDTIGRRTVAYILLLVIVVLAIVVSVNVMRTVRQRTAVTGVAWAAAAGSGVMVVVVACLVLPASDPIPARFPAQLLWEFRLVSLAALAAMWTAIGLVMASLCSREPDPVGA